MCGIAGYSLSSRSAVSRTLAAQSLLAGIAERGADAVGYAHRSPDGAYPVVTKQRTPASKLLERIDVPQGATELLVHVRDYTKGHPSISANNHPVRHGPVVGIHNGIILNDDELLAPSEVEGSVPLLGILVSIEEAYTQCSKALIRSDLWNPERHIERSDLPSAGEILRSLNDPTFNATEYDEARAERYARREGLY